MKLSIVFLAVMILAGCSPRRWSDNPTPIKGKPVVMERWEIPIGTGVKK